MPHGKRAMIARQQRQELRLRHLDGLRERPLRGISCLARPDEAQRRNGIDFAVSIA